MQKSLKYGMILAAVYRFICYVSENVLMGKTYVENGSCTTEDEVDRALDVALMVIMSAFVIKQSVVQAVERTMVERYFIGSHKRCHRLVLRRERHSDWCIILFIHNTNSLTHQCH